ncbi:hypothetical protein C8R47DRAFT_1078965 [Mycena vitilis]|nr:hypothetical protein C8R47DRAFT_1078965 [Mycena vitilis]
MPWLLARRHRTTFFLLIAGSCSRDKIVDSVCIGIRFSLVFLQLAVHVVNQTARYVAEPQMSNSQLESLSAEELWTLTIGELGRVLKCELGTRPSNIKKYFDTEMGHALEEPLSKWSSKNPDSRREKELILKREKVVKTVGILSWKAYMHDFDNLTD